MLLSILLQVASPDSISETATVAAAAAETPSNSLWDLAIKGGVIMIPIGIMAILAMYIAIERWLTISKAEKIDMNFMSQIKDMVLNDNIMGAQTLCSRTNTPIAHIIEKGISRVGKPIHDIDSSMENVGRMEIYKIEKNVGFLSTIAGLAPMFGFLGTIFGVTDRYHFRRTLRENGF
jgi:biopolymer transport protein ExbB